MVPTDLRRRRRRGILLVAVGVGVVVAVWAVLAVVSLFAARDDATAGVDHLEDARELITPEEIVEGEGRELLEAARDDFDSAHDRVTSPLIAPLRALPIVGRQVRSVDALTGSASDVVTAGLDAFDDAQAALDSGVESPLDRVAVARDIEALAARLLAVVTDLDLGPDEALVGALSDARVRFESELADLEQDLSEAETAARGLGDLLEGPSVYLVLAANNAEMRVGSGSFLSVGRLEVAGGEFTLTEFLPSEALLLPDEAVPLEGDLARNWAWLRPNVDFRVLGTSADFPVQAELAADMWEALVGEQVDGVVALDPVALSEVLGATGSIEVDGQTITADSVVDEILVRQYEGFDIDSEQGGRRDRLGSIARSTFDALDAGEWEPADLVRGLGDAAAGRHILVWSRDPAQSDAWAAAGVTGELSGDEIVVGLYNRAPNKLDRYLEVDGVLAVDADENVTEVSVALEATNAAPDDLPDYALGLSAGTPIDRLGDYVGLLVVHLPGDAQNVIVHVDGDLVTGFVAIGPDGASQLLALPVDLEPGASTTVAITFDLAERSLTISPSARVPPIDWTFEGERWADTQPRAVAW